MKGIIKNIKSLENVIFLFYFDCKYYITIENTIKLSKSTDINFFFYMHPYIILTSE